MLSQCLYIVLYSVVFIMVKCEERTENNTEFSGRTARYNGFQNDFENRLPQRNIQDRFYDSAGLYPEFADRRGPYTKEQPLPYEVPTGFDQFVPDKSDRIKKTYGPDEFYFPYPSFTQQNSNVETSEEEDKVPSVPSLYNTLASNVKDFVLKFVRLLFGNNDPDSILFDEKPSVLYVVKQLIKDPVVAVTILLVPLTFLFSTVVPFIAKMLMKSSIVPAVTSTIASAVARSLEGPARGHIFQAVTEFGARAINDPRCLQRFLCQAAKSHIESRSGDAWSAQYIIRKLAKAVDGNLWKSFGMSSFFNSLQNGHCENLPCSEATAHSIDMPFIEKFSKVFAKLFNYTVTDVM